MNDFYALIKVQQGRLKSAMKKMGVCTAIDLSRKAGTSYTAVNELLNFRMSPKTKYGEWRLPVLSICKVLGYEPDELSPKNLDRVIQTNSIEAFSDYNQLQGNTEQLQLNPAEEAESNDCNAVLFDALQKLPERERDVVVSRIMEGKTLEECGKKWRCTRSNIARIEAKALNELRKQAENNEPIAELA